MRLFASLLIATFCFCAFSNDWKSFMDFKVGETYVLMADKVNVREGPSLEDAVSTQLPFGTELTYLSGGEPLRHKGVPGSFVLVSWLEGDKERQGYIWDGFIAAETLSIGSSRMLLFGPHQMTTEAHSGWEQLEVQIRTATHQGFVEMTSFPSIGGLNHIFKMHLHDARGLKGIDYLLEIEFSGEACGLDAGSIFLSLRANSLTYLFRTHEGSDAPVFQEQTVIFPSDSGGVEGKILVHTRAGEYIGEGEEELTVDKIEQWLWKNGQIIKLDDEQN